VSRRARAVALLGVSASCAAAAALLVNGYAADVRAQVGPRVPVLVAASDIPRGRTVRPRDAYQRWIPRRFVPPGAFVLPGEVVGLRSRVPIVRGGYLLENELEPPGAGPPAAASSPARIIEVPVAGAGSLSGLVGPGARVDVLVTSDRGAGSPRTYLALQRAQLVSLRPPSGDSAPDSADPGEEAVAALRVSLRQAVLLTAAHNFAREVRLVPRAGKDSRRLSGVSVTADQLRP
jgi:pilus assembly protein CpaB